MIEMSFSPNHYGRMLFNENEQPTWSPTSMPPNYSAKKYEHFKQYVDSIPINYAELNDMKTGVKKSITLYGTTYQVPVYHTTTDYLSNLMLKFKVSGSILILLSNQPISAGYTLFIYNYDMDRAFIPVVDDEWFERMRGQDISTVFDYIPEGIRIMGIGNLALWGVNNNVARRGGKRTTRHTTRNKRRTKRNKKHSKR